MENCALSQNIARSPGRIAATRRWRPWASAKGTATAPKAVGDVRALPAGLFCRDLAARGATYGEAVAYWWYYNRPARMDADNNGIPCETVYSTATVNAFWFS